MKEKQKKELKEKLLQERLQREKEAKIKAEREKKRLYDEEEEWCCKPCLSGSDPKITWNKSYHSICDT